jgi:hypothetical protein
MAEDVTTLDTIRDLKRREPFSPFRIVMASGDRYTIEDPDALAIGRSQLHYFPPKVGGGIHMRFSQISSVEDQGDRARRLK